MIKTIVEQKLKHGGTEDTEEQNMMDERNKEASDFK
jgi:hypothetical protein